MNINCTKYHSKKQEKRVSKATRGKEVIGSGATPFMKGDVSKEYMLLECKTNTKKQESMSVKREWFTKIKHQALEMGKFMYAIVISFGEGIDYYCVDGEQFQMLLEGYEKLDEILHVVNNPESDSKDYDKIKDIVQRKY